MKGKISYYKGIAFEQRFSIYMISELKYDKVRRRKSMTGNENVKGSQADIIGIINDPRGSFFKKASMGLLIIGLALFISIGILRLSNDLLWFVMLFVIGGFIYGLLATKLQNEYTWVECKNRTKVTDIRMIRDFYNEVQDYNSSKDRKYTISKLIFVFASGFVDNALQFATDKRIQCYSLDGNSFKRIEY